MEESNCVSVLFLAYYLQIFEFTFSAFFFSPLPLLFLHRNVLHLHARNGKGEVLPANILELMINYLNKKLICSFLLQFHKGEYSFYEYKGKDLEASLYAELT